MKTIRKHLRLISLLLAFTFLQQSCSVYHSSTASIDEAIQSNVKIKLASETEDNYEFQELQRENGNIYGITKWKSVTADLLSAQIVEDTKDQKNVKILLRNDQLNNIHLQNKTMSTLATIGIPLVVVGIIVIIARKSISPSFNFQI
ncbi:MAG: hypothetical protein ACYCZ2_16450 [Lutibacter sp.]|nr:MAG: hypothetical protein APF83_04555 [Lutibacter sp. BRH_c52]HCE54861.1 hypothetical protein [Lutibacter sp.]